MKVLNNNEIEVVSGAGKHVDNGLNLGKAIGSVFDAVKTIFNAKNTSKFSEGFGSIGSGLGSFLEFDIFGGFGDIIAGIKTVSSSFWGEAPAKPEKPAA